MFPAVALPKVPRLLEIPKVVLPHDKIKALRQKCDFTESGGYDYPSFVF